MKTKIIKGMLIGLIVAGIGVTGVCMVHAKHTAEAKQQEILLCKEETKWYYRTENGVLQKRQWSLTYGKWMTEWMNVAGTEIPGNGTVEVPSHETDTIPEKKEGLLAKSNNEIRDAAYNALGLNSMEWFGKYLKKTSEEAVLLLYPPSVRVTQTDSFADLEMSSTECICLVSVRPDGEELSFTAVKEYGVSQVGVYEKEAATFFGIVLRERNELMGLEDYGMIWYRIDEAGDCNRVCYSMETNGLYDYWETRKPTLSTDGTITISHVDDGELKLDVTVFLSVMRFYEKEYGISGPELIRKVIQEDEKRDDLYFKVGYAGAEVTHYIKDEESVYFVIKKYGDSHQAGFESAVIGAMDLSGNILQCELVQADRMNTVYLKTIEKNYGQCEADYLVLSTETEYQGLVSSAKQVFRTDETGFVRTWITRVNGYEYVIDYDVERIPITEDYFSDEAFQTYIKEKIDTNGDGFLTKKEREQVRSIDFDAGHYRWLLKDTYTEKKTVLDGLNWFPNLERLELMSEAEVYLYQHPGITVINWNESGSSLVFAEDCNKLEQIAVHLMSSGGAIYAKNCKELKQILNYDGQPGAVYTAEMPNCVVTNNEPAFPTEMPESKVKPADPETERIPISEEYFSGRYFRGFIKAFIDTDGDGFLTKQEREQVTEIDLDIGGDAKLLEDVNVVDGLNWFPNMEYIGHMDGRVFEIYLDHHPGVKGLSSAEVWNEATYFIDGCDKLESIWFCTNGDMALFVNDCKNLKSIDGYEYDFSSLYVSECPNVKVYIDETVGFPSEWYLDDDAQVAWAAFDFDGSHYMVGTLYRKEGDLEEAIENIHWLGFEQESISFSKQTEQILAMQEVDISKELLDADKVTTNLRMILFSPRKSSIYYAESKEKDNRLYWEYLAKKYYVVEENGTITAYDSFEEMCATTKEVEGLEDISTVLKE